MQTYSPQWWRRGKNSHRSLDAQLISSLSPSRLPSLKQLKYLPKIISPREFFFVKIIVVIILLNVGFLSWRFYDFNTVKVPRVGGAYTEALVGSPQYLNPILFQNNDADRDLVSVVFTGLLEYNADRALAPELAERYEISSDQLTYTFYLRKDVHWHDGDPFTADDVVFTIQQIKDPKVKSPLYLSFKDVAIQKVDDFTVQFGLKKPYAPFLDLATTRIIPAHLWKNIAPENFYLASLNTKPIGTGPLKYKSFKKDKDGTIRSYTFVRNAEFYGAKTNLEKFTAKFYPDSDSAIQALKNHNVQGISFLPRDLRSKLVKDKGLQYYTFQVPQYTALFFNQSLNADLQSKAVRQALAYAIDRERIVRDVFANEASVVNAPLLPGFLGYDPTIPRYDYSASHAADLLATAGWKKNEQGSLVREAGKKKNAADSIKPLAISLTTINSPENAKVAQIVKENWEALGVTVEVVLADATRIKPEIIDTRSYQALLYGEIIGSDPDLYPFWHSSQAHAPGLNLAVFANSDADALLEAGRETTDQGKRADAYGKFQRILAEQVPAVFLYSPTYNYVVSSAIKGIKDKKQIIYPSDRFVDIDGWYSKIKRQRKGQ